MKKALFAGTFDPPTLGHLEIIQRASRLCQHLYIAVAANGKHKNALPQKQRIAWLKTITKTLKNVEIVPLKGLVVDLANELKVDALVRGLRNGTDLDYEAQMGTANHLLSGIETIYLIASPQYSHVNASLIREIASYGKTLEGFVPPEIEQEVFEWLYRP